MKNIRSKKIITVLLFLSCIVCGFLFAMSPPPKIEKLDTNADLDSLLTLHFSDFEILPYQVRKSNIQIDSSFYRVRYRVNVPIGFSKTMFHYHLHQKLSKYNVESPARVNFPDRDMNIYIYQNNTIHASLHLITWKE